MKQFIYILLAFSLTHPVKGQTAAKDNKVSESITFSDPPRGRDIYGIFEGRTPCDISRQLGAGVVPGCDLLKWQIIFFMDTVTMKPTTYILTTGLFERRPLKGTWKITHGMEGNSSAVVYALDYGQPAKVLYLLKGDENVLFILDEHLAFRTGNLDVSYTLNRVRKVRRIEGQ